MTDTLTFLASAPEAVALKLNAPLFGAWVERNYESLEETRTASVTIRDQFDLPVTLVAGQTHDEHVKQAVLEGISAFIKKFFGEVRWWLRPSGISKSYQCSVANLRWSASRITPDVLIQLSAPKHCRYAGLLFPLPLGEGQGEGAKRREKEKGWG